MAGIDTYQSFRAAHNQHVDEPTETQLRAARAGLGDILTVARDRRAAAVLHRQTDPDSPELWIHLFFRNDDGRWIELGGGSVPPGEGSQTYRSFDADGSITVRHGDEADRWIHVTWTPPGQAVTED